MAVKPKDLCSRILGRKVVKVKNNKGQYDEFEICRISVTEFANFDVGHIQDLVGKDEKEIQQILLDDLRRKSISEAFAPILLKGIITPKVVKKSITDCDLENEIPIDVLLIDIELCSNLFNEILKISH